jgi:hypothetical protein
VAAKAKAVDWVTVEADYRAGVKTLRAIASEHGISNVAIVKRAKKCGWVRDLSAAIRAKAEEKVSKAAVSKTVSKRREASAAAVVEANADLQSDLILTHRKDIGVARKVVNDMLAELGILGDPSVQEGLRLLAMKDASENGGAAAMKAMLKAVEAAVALPGRAVVVQKLTVSLTALIEKERQAFGIDKVNQEDSLASFLKGLDAPRAAA